MYDHNFDDVDDFIDDDFDDPENLRFSSAPKIQWATENLRFSSSVLDSLNDWEYAEHRYKMRMQKIVRRKGVKSALLKLIEQILATESLPRLIYGENNPLYGLIHSPYTQPRLALRTAKRWKQWHEREFVQCNKIEDFSNAAMHKLKSIQFKNMRLQAAETIRVTDTFSILYRGSGKNDPSILMVGAQKSDFGRVVHNVGNSEPTGGFKKQRIRHVKQK